MPASPILPVKPPIQDEFGCNLDPMKCDCGKEDCCPLWTQEWKNYYRG